MVFRDLSFNRLSLLRENFQEIRNDISGPRPKDLESLKYVLNVITNLADAKVEMQLSCDELVERYRTLKMYAIELDPNEYLSAENLVTECKKLMNLGKTMDLRLVRVKARFREVTKGDVQKFKERVIALQTRYIQSGPSNSSIPLSDAFALFEEFTQEIAKCQARQAELVNAEQLFNLDFYKQVGYPELTDVVGRMQKLKHIFDVFIAYRNFYEDQSSKLWADLDVPSLEGGVKDLEMLQRKLDKSLKEIPTFRNLQNTISAFKESIPLIASLKNDAMKARHWEKIMKATNIQFEMDPKTFTVGKLFQMELNRFTDVRVLIRCGGVVLCIGWNWSCCFLSMVNRSFCFVCCIFLLFISHSSFKPFQSLILPSFPLSLLAIYLYLSLSVCLSLALLNRQSMTS